MTTRQFYIAANGVILVVQIALMARPALLAPLGLMPWFFPIWVALCLLALFVQVVVTCPHCGHSLAFREVEWGGLRGRLYMPWPPKDCPGCGVRL